MKRINRKVKFTLIFFVCWFVLMMGLVDGLIKFENVLKLFGGSQVATEIALWTVVLLPTILVYIFTKKEK